MPSPATFERIVPWAVRVAWVAVLVLGGAAVDGATADRSEAVGSVARFGGLTLWVAGVAAMAVPAVVTLTASRLIVPMAVPAAIAAWVAGADTIDAVPFVAVALVATALVLAGEFGRAFVQASAYGEEERHVLRAPLAYAAMSAVVWALAATGAVTGPLLLAARLWVAGAAVSVATMLLVVWGWPRWHRLARRWLVVVPVGLVIHDHLVLAETVMLPRPEIATVRLAPADTEAADLTGPAAGHALEIITTGPVTAIFAPSPADPRGTAIHLTACLVAPSRPGRALEAIGRRRLPVG